MYNNRQLFENVQKYEYFALQEKDIGYNIISSLRKRVIIMNEKKVDLRVVKTKRLLYATLLELMKEKTFEEIKVSDICNKALVNRSTFYSHYQDKYDLFSELVMDIKNVLAIELSKNKKINSVKDYYIEMMSIFIDYIENNKDIYKAILVNNKNSITMDIVYDVMNEDIHKHIAEFGNIMNKNIPIEIITRFYLGGVFNVGMQLLNDSYNYSKEDVIKYMSLLIPDDIPDK